jgi:hypothetical protein
MHLSRWRSSLAFIVVLGCGATTEVARQVEPITYPAPSAGVFTTDAIGYRPKLLEPGSDFKIYGFTVITRYTNPTAAPIYLATCFPLGPHPSVGVVYSGTTSGESIAYNGASACVGHDWPIEVAPGATRIDTLQFRGPNAFDHFTHQPLDNVLDGKFQLLYGPMRCRQQQTDCFLSTESLRRSNEFIVQLAK